jgi:hypothetical protein
MSYIPVNTLCKCGHSKHRHIIEGKRPTKKHPFFASSGWGSYPIGFRYKGKCTKCKCNGFEVKK